MMKKLKIVAGVTIIGGAIAGIAGSQIKHRDCQEVDPGGYVSASSHLSSRHINNPSDKHSSL
jgi:hypothetical protein